MLRRALPLLALAFFAGCSKSPNSGATSADMAPQPESVAAPSASDQTTKEAGTAPLAVSVPQIAYVYDLGFVLPESAIGHAQETHVALCDRLGPARCQVLGLERQASDGGTSAATLKLRVASADARTFEAAAERAIGKAGGRTANTSIAAEDVSKDISDTEARLRQRELLVQRLTEILRTRQGKLTDLLEAERSVAAAQEEVDQARSWLAELKGRVAMSTFNLSYSATAPSSRNVPVRLGESVAGSASVFVRGLSAILTLAIYLLPWAVVAALLWLLWRWAVPRMRKRDAEETDAAPE